MDNRLWQGVFKHKWIAFAAIGISFIFSCFVISQIVGFFGGSPAEVDLYQNSLIDAESLEDAKNNNQRNASIGGSKYLLMIILEIVVFYFSLKTIEILSQTTPESNFRVFWKAEIRMIKVLIRGFVQALVIQILISIATAVLGLSDWINTFLMFFVYAYFLGHAIFDNYCEQQRIDIKTSEKVTQQHFGATFVLGVVTSGLILIPLIGPVVAPILAAITANIYGYQFKIQDDIPVLTPTEI